MMKLPEIKGFIDVSLVDWDGKVSGVIFLPKCNFRCPFCHNSSIVLKPDQIPTIPFERIRQYLVKKKGWLDGVVITGGEPTIHGELSNLCEQIKDLNLQVKLDTNGSNPRIVEDLTVHGLVDYIAMDIKAPLNVEKYSIATGIPIGDLLGEVKKTVKFLLKGQVDYEFRTTVCHPYHKPEDFEKIGKLIKGAKNYYIQNFVTSKHINSKINFKPFSEKELEESQKIIKKYIKNSKVR